jgi:hypothetical protein
MFWQQASGSSRISQSMKPGGGPAGARPKRRSTLPHGQKRPTALAAATARGLARSVAAAATKKKASGKAAARRRRGSSSGEEEWDSGGGGGGDGGSDGGSEGAGDGGAGGSDGEWAPRDGGDGSEAAGDPDAGGSESEASDGGGEEAEGAEFDDLDEGYFRERVERWEAARIAGGSRRGGGGSAGARRGRLRRRGGDGGEEGEEGGATAGGGEEEGGEEGEAEGEGKDEEEDVVFDGGFRVPGWLWGRLFDYQRTAVKWLWELHTQRAGGILGDEMGLGKTIQVGGAGRGGRARREGWGRASRLPRLATCSPSIRLHATQPPPARGPRSSPTSRGCTTAGCGGPC